MNRGSHHHHDNSVTAVTVLSSCMMVLALCASASAAIVFEFTGNLRLDEGRHGQPRPVSVSTDATTGEIVVSDAAGSALHVMHPAGGARFVTGMIAGLSSPSDAALTADGGFVFLDSNSEQARTIRRLDLVGEPVSYLAVSPVAGWRPDHLTLSADGHFLTLDNTSGLLVKHDHQSGEVLWSRSLWSNTGAETVCGRPAVSPDGSIYIPLSQDHRILVLTADGRPDGSFGTLGTTPGKFSFPVDVAFGPLGTVMVLDRMRHVILVFDQEHQFITEYGRMGASPGAFYHPASLAYASGRVYVAQGFEGRVQVYDVFSTDAINRGR